VKEATQEQRAAAVAHLLDIAGRLLRSGDYMRCHPGAVPSILISAKWLLDPDANPWHYRDGLQTAGLTPEAIDAAVTAILDGRHPADSLPGQVERMRDEAKEEGNALRLTETRGMAYHSGKVSAADDVLSLLGCKVTP
jgi:hypothetical protein